MDTQQEEWIPLPVNEADEIRALVIEMRRYMLRHDINMGECVAWNKLKHRFLVAESSTGWQDDLRWLEQHRRATR